MPGKAASVTGGIPVPSAVSKDLKVTTDTTISANATYDNVLVTSSATLTINGGASLTANNSFTVDSGATLLMNNATLTSSGVTSVLGTFNSSNASDVATFAGDSGTSGTWVITGALTLSSGTSNAFSGSSISGNGTITISGTLTLQANATVDVSLAGTGTLATSNFTLTISANHTWSVANITGAFTLTLTGGGHTITIGANATWTIAAFGGSTLTISIGSGYTLTHATNNLTWGGTVLNGSSGTFSTSVTETLNGAMTWSIQTIAGTGTLNFTNTYYFSTNPTYLQVAVLTGAGGIGAPIATTVVITIGNGATGIAISLAMLSNGVNGLSFPNSGTITITGQVNAGAAVSWSAVAPFALSGTSAMFWSNGLTRGTTDAVPASPTSGAISGTGIWIVATANNITATNTLTITALATAAGADIATGKAGTIKLPGYTLTAVSGSATGKYGLGVHYGTTFHTFAWIYIGTLSNSYNVTALNVQLADSVNDSNTNPTNGRNTTGSAGTITLTGVLYV